MGTRLPKCSSPSFRQKVKEAIPEKVREALLPLVQLADALSDCIQSYDQKIEELGSEKYGHTKLLRQVKGVGPITALAYVLTLENPEHFAKSRDVGPYLGLVPKQEDSGESQPQLGISKTGDTMVRKLRSQDIVRTPHQGTPAAGWVLPNSRSKSGHIEYISEYSFRRARKQLNLPSNLVLYCARHDYGTNAMIATGNISVVGKLMGHNSVTMTARYSHPPESESQRIRALIDSRLCTLSAHGVVPIDSTTRKQRVN